jgi:hypothetical protein
VDTTLSQKTVVVTVETDERIRSLTPELSLYVSNALDAGKSATLDEKDTFRVSCDDPEDDEEDHATCDRVLRQYGDRSSDGEEIAAGDELDADEKIRITLSKGPIMDRSRDGALTIDDVMIGGEQNAPASGATPSDVDVVTDKVLADTETANYFEAEDGIVTVELSKKLAWGDRFTISYRGDDADSAEDLVSIAGGKQVTSTSWTFTLNIERPDTYAVTVSADDGGFSQGSGGVPDPTAAGATIFEIDNELAGGDPARTVPFHDPTGSNPVSISEPFFIELYWDGSEADVGKVTFTAGNEGKEYEGDSSKMVTLTKAVLTGPEFDGVDVLDMAVRQSAGSWRMGIEGMDVGSYTLKYNAQDSLENSNETDRTLSFTVQPVPSWDLGLTAGMNLVSLPSEPANGDVNEVFGTAEQVNLIFTFEGGQSMVAIRNQDTGGFVGTLTTIDAQHAYWVSAENAVTIEVSIPPTSQLAPPPYIQAKGGQWNLLPVISLGAVDDDTEGIGAAPGTDVDADSYLGEFRTAFGWDGRGWNKLDPDGETVEDRLTNGPYLQVGKGYWVLYEKDVIITP